MAQTQNYSAESVENLATAFPRRSENSFAWGNAISYFLGLPALRGFWPMSSVNENGSPIDLSGQGRTLTNNNGATYGIYGLQSYASFDGVNQYFSRASEAGLNITGALTLGGWCRWNDAAGIEAIAGKFLTVGDQRAYHLRRDAGMVIAGYVNGSGLVGGNVVASTTGIITAGKWHFCAMSYTPSIDLSVMLDNEIVSLAVGIPASLFVSAADYNIGAYNNGANGRMNGDTDLQFLCAAAVPKVQLKAIYWLTRPLFYGS